jgi:hypothetical protein
MRAARRSRRQWKMQMWGQPPTWLQLAVEYDAGQALSRDEPLPHLGDGRADTAPMLNHYAVFCYQTLEKSPVFRQIRAAFA